MAFFRRNGSLINDNKDEYNIALKRLEKKRKEQALYDKVQELEKRVSDLENLVNHLKKGETL